MNFQQSNHLFIKNSTIIFSFHLNRLWIQLRHDWILRFILGLDFLIRISLTWATHSTTNHSENCNCFSYELTSLIFQTKSDIFKHEILFISSVFWYQRKCNWKSLVNWPGLVDEEIIMWIYKETCRLFPFIPGHLTERKG